MDPLSLAVLDRLTRYDWSGNIRELENVLERAIILSPGAALELDAIQLGPAGRPAPRSPVRPAPTDPPPKTTPCKPTTGRTSSRFARLPAGRSKARTARPADSA